MLILIATPRAVALSAFADALAQDTGAELRFADSWPNVEATVRTLAPAFVVLDEGLEGGAPLDLARRLVMVDAMVNVAVVSGLGAEAFHEASEGLGILAPVPLEPGAADGAALAQVFRRFL
ncbi:MAG: hypothetical protein P4L39_11605 [Humidesulfovibrio sp.]|nr:hypothetical protein [Humidesulfovibrio sp.]